MNETLQPFQLELEEPIVDYDNEDKFVDDEGRLFVKVADCFELAEV